MIAMGTAIGDAPFRQWRAAYVARAASAICRRNRVLARQGVGHFRLHMFAVEYGPDSLLPGGGYGSPIEWLYLDVLWLVKLKYRFVKYTLAAVWP